MEKQESIRAASRGHSVGWTGVAGAEEVLDLVMIMVKNGRTVKDGVQGKWLLRTTDTMRSSDVI